MSTSQTVPQFGLGDRMRKSRELAHLDQAAMAARLDVSRALVSMWERGLSDPRSEQLRKWSEETAQPMWWLLDLEAASNFAKGAYINSDIAAAA